MASLMDIVRRPAMVPWANGGIPWQDPEFSERILREHLSQEHDQASRRSEVIDAHVDWMDQVLLGGRPGRVLDLGCGPGLYTSRLAGRGHDCVGIDFSPASVRHAREQADKQGHRCAYRCEDITRADYGGGFDLVMLLSGELNVFRPEAAKSTLGKANAALADSGQLLLEVDTAASARAVGTRAPFWYTAERGVFSTAPHVLLQEHGWHAQTRTATIRYLVVDAEAGDVTMFSETRRMYTDGEYLSILADAGFGDVEMHPVLPGTPGGAGQRFVAIVARKAASGDGS